MSSNAPLDELEVELMRLLRNARGGQRRTAADVHAALDNAGYAVLVAVRELSAEGQGVRGSELSEALALHKSTISRSLTALEDLGLVERIADRTDARARQARLTTEGVAALDRASQGRRERLRSQVSGWDIDDIAELASLLRRLNDTALA